MIEEGEEGRGRRIRISVPAYCAELSILGLQSDLSLCMQVSVRGRGPTASKEEVASSFGTCSGRLWMQDGRNIRRRCRPLP